MAFRSEPMTLQMSSSCLELSAIPKAALPTSLLKHATAPYCRPVLRGRGVQPLKWAPAKFPTACTYSKSRHTQLGSKPFATTAGILFFIFGEGREIKTLSLDNLNFLKYNITWPLKPENFYLKFKQCWQNINLGHFLATTTNWLIKRNENAAA